MIRRLILALSLATALPASAFAVEGGEAIKDAPEYKSMAPISFTVIGSNDKIESVVAVKLAIELEKGKTKQALEPYDRQLLDAFLVALQSAYEAPRPSGTPVSIESLKEKLLDAAVGVTGPGYVKAVLVESIGERGRGH